MGEMATSCALGTPATTTRPQRPSRWHSLDVLKGLALWGMIAHHFQKWATGDVDGRFVGFDDYAVTDLAAPAFGLALGAAALVVGARIRTRAQLARPTLRWAQILVVGIVIDFATHGAVRGTGVLPTLAVLGFTIMVGAAAGLRRPAPWWGIAGLCAVLAVPASRAGGEAILVQLLDGPFPLPVYGVFATGGAAVAAHGLGGDDQSLPLLRSAAGVFAAGLAAAVLAGGVVAPEGIWPPARYPGHLGFTLWGLCASLLVWAAIRALLPDSRGLGAALARAGQRTLVVFAAHFVVKIVLTQLGLIGELDTRRWGLVVWLGVAVACAVSTVPTRRRRPRVISSRDEIVVDAEVPVVRPSTRGPRRSGSAP